MSFPTWQIKVYNTSDALTHTITTDILNASFTDELTSGVGSFTFTVPAMAGRTNTYDDIGNFYKVEIYPGYAGSYTHLFTGRITDMSTQANNEPTRTFTGKGLGEILERFLKKNKRWQDVDASVIAADLADDLGYTGATADIDADTNDETITVASETYYDVLRKVSDYWYDATHQVKKDFGIDKDGVFFWKTRPLRTVGVETISNILNYDLKYSIIASKNNIQVLGAASAPLPLDYDEWTDSLDYWTATTGTLALEGTSPKEGTYWVQCSAGALGKEEDFTLTFPQTLNLRTINKLSFWCGHDAASDTTNELKIYCPDASNCYTYQLDAVAGSDLYDITLGDSNVYDATNNPTGELTATGSPNWWSITALNFHYKDSTLTNTHAAVDRLYLFPERWKYTANAEDATNQTNYGEREAEYTDETLNTSAMCQKKQQTLLYQQKDRILRLDFTVIGNTNILAGDRLTITLPLDNLTAQAFDVVSVTQTFSKAPLGYQTTARCLNTTSTRRLPPTSPLESIKLNLQGTRDVISDIYGKIVK